MAEWRRLAIPDVIEIVPRRFADPRGWFAETWSEATFAGIGIDHRWVQDNHSHSRDRGVLRGLHCQLPPLAQAKLVRVSRGSIHDVAVDLRRGSPTRGRWVGLTLSAEAGNQLYIPVGFAHGFVTVEDDCEVQYKASAPYDAASERAIRHDDPAIGIEWPEVGPLTLSARDRAAPLLADAGVEF